VGLCVVFEEEDSVVLGGEVLQFVPLAALETFKTLVLSEFLTQDLLSCILQLVFELQLVLFPHLHLHSLGLLFSLLVMIRLRLRFPVLVAVLFLIHLARITVLFNLRMIAFIL